MTGLTLDAGALIALEREDRTISSLLARNAFLEGSVTIPATALAQVIRDPRRQARLMRLTRHAATKVVPLDMDDATFIGQMLAASRTTDIPDAHVVLCARRAGQAIVTSDPDDLRALDPRAKLIVI